MSAPDYYARAVDLILKAHGYDPATLDEIDEAWAYDGDPEIGADVIMGGREAES